MKEKVTEHMTLIEQRRQQYPGEEMAWYSRYMSNVYVPDDGFKKAIELMGGYIYNTVVGKIGSIIVFNGFTWVSVTSDSFKENDEILLKLEETLESIGWEKKEVKYNLS